MKMSFAGSEGWKSRTPAIWSHEVAPLAVSPRPGTRGLISRNAPNAIRGPCHPRSLV